MLLQEYTVLNTNTNLIKEEYEKTGKIILSGVLQRANALNQNKRVYPKQILAREVQNYMKAVNESRALGELDHPDTEVINLANVSHIIREVWWDNDDVVGKLEVLNTNAGKILKELVLAGVKVGISSRGLGSLREELDEVSGNRKLVVQDDFNLISWDVVSTPSTQGAYLLMKEGKILDPKYQTLLNIDNIIDEILLTK